jgi:aryl-alcohol dehydrogenase-like predicted oxidoreductase
MNDPGLTATGQSANPWLIPRPRTQSGSPLLAVGTMNFGKRTSATDSERIVARALERGLCFFDTANVYSDGESERILGRALGRSRERCFIATKVGLKGIPNRAEGLSAAAILHAIDESLGRLGTEYVDVYYLHAPDKTTRIEETLDAMKTLLDGGKVRAWGVSNYASWQILEMNRLADAREMMRPALSQVIYNLVIRQLDIEYLKFTARHPVHTTVYNPLAGGLLSGKHSRAEIPKGSRFDGNRMYLRRYWTERMFELVSALQGVAREEGMDLVTLAYAWLAGRPGVDSILVGPADVGQLDAAIDACARTLSESARARLDEVHYAFAGTDATYAR